MEIKNCPYCAEEISAEAIKCKHCGESIAENSDFSVEVVEVEEVVEEDAQYSRSFPNYIKSPILIGIGWAIIHFGGWVLTSGSLGKIINELNLSIAWVYKEWKWQLPNSIADVLTADIPSSLWGEHSMLVRINDSYYGLICTSKYFDSPFIQWIMLGVGLYLIVSALFSLIFAFNKRD